MGQQIVKQPNGKYAVWSSGVDDFILVNVEVCEIIEEFAEWERQKIIERVNSIVDALERGDKPYHQFTRSYDECVALIREHHGDDAESLELLQEGKR